MDQSTDMAIQKVSQVEVVVQTAANNALSLADQQKALTIAKQINILDSTYVVNYGNESQKKMSSFADSVLGQVKSGDAGEIGGKLNDVVIRARSLDLSVVTKGQGILSKLPLVGNIFNRVARFKQNFNSLSTQIESVTKELQKTQTALVDRNRMLDDLYKANLQQFVDLNILIEAGNQAIDNVSQSLIPVMEQEVASSNDQLKVQELNDMKQALVRFERKVHDLELTRMSVLQTAPQIRLIQSNNQALAEKIQSTIYLTVPLWKKQFLMAISLMEQAKAAELDKTITDANNDLLNSNAKLLQQNTVSVARANERGVIDIQTLENVQKTLLDTCEEVAQIQAEGKKNREEAKRQLVQMEQDLKQRLIK
jgi:uncharacterized protein YaaN involved in tellurite resistance